MQFLSINKEQVKGEVQHIIDDIWEKYPHFSSGDFRQGHDGEDNLTVLQILPVLILCLNDKRHQELIDIILPKLNDDGSSIRETILKIISVCIPYFNDKNRELMFAAIRSKLNDREPKVRFVAQQIVSEHLSQHESSLQTNDAVWELSNGINSIYENAFPEAATCMAYFDDDRHQK